MDRKRFLQRFDDKQIRNVDYVLTKKYYNELNKPKISRK